MTVDDIKAEVARIEASRGDDEIAHSMEDALHSSVLAAIAAGKCDNPAACAAAALKTYNIKFARWCA